MGWGKRVAAWCLHEPHDVLVCSNLFPSPVMAGMNAMCCYLEAVQHQNDNARLLLGRVLHMLILEEEAAARTLEKHVKTLPEWVWIPWVPNLLAFLNRPAAPQIRNILRSIIFKYPQSIYCTFRACFLERRESPHHHSGTQQQPLPSSSSSTSSSTSTCSSATATVPQPQQPSHPQAIGQPIVIPPPVIGPSQYGGQPPPAPTPVPAPNAPDASNIAPHQTQPGKQIETRMAQGNGVLGVIACVHFPTQS